MSDQLSPEEIEALLSSVAEEELAPDTGTESSIGTRRLSATPSSTGPGSSHQGTASVETYDFRRPDKLSKEQLRKLHMLHETHGRLTSSALAAYLRTPVYIELISVEQVPYEEYLRSINDSVFAIMSLAPLNGQAVLEMEFGLVFSMIDRMLGGPGKSVSRTALTDLERPLVLQLIDRILGALKNAWEPVVLVNPDVEVIETSSQFVQIATPNDTAITILSEVRFGNQRGAMSLCIPYLVLKPITQKLSAQKWLSTGSRKRSDELRNLISQHIARATINCRIELGSTTLRIGDFIKLNAGDVIRLDQKQQQDLKLRINDQTKFIGQPALHGKRIVFRVAEKAK